jgi:hypothetical protein
MTPKTRKPNLFLDMGIDPDAPWNQAEFDRLCKEKQREWSRESSGFQKTAALAKAKLESLPSFKRIAADPAARGTEAAAARVIRKETQAAVLEEIDKRLQFLESKGFLLEEELQGLVKDFAAAFTGADIRKRVKVPIKANARPESPKHSMVQPLEPAVANKVRQHLNTLGQPDLYQFLQLTPASGCEQLRNRAEQEHRAMLRNANKTVEVTARQELAGLCLTLLGTPEQKARYDETLRQERIQKLIEMVDVSARSTKQIVQAQMDELQRYAAKECGIQPKDAEAAILDYATTKGYMVVVSRPEGGPPPMRRCGRCDRLNEQGKSNCTNCGEPLQAPCPKCQKPVQSDEQACGACGFPAGNRSFVRGMLGALDAAMADHDYELANTLLGQTCKAWPAPAGDPLVMDIEKRAKQVAPVVAQTAELEHKLDDAARARRYCEARDFLDALAKLRPESEGPAGKRASFDAAIRQADREVTRARSLAGAQTDAAIGALQEALRQCADHREALDLLSKLPPGPPSGLSASIHGELVQLAWQPSSSPGIGYVVVRKGRARPTSADDGTRLATVSGTTYDDERPEIGVPLHYAVYADRGGVTSSAAALLNQPVLVLADVKNLTATVSSGTVELAWQTPPNAYDVRVVRSDRTNPRSENEGQLVPLASTGKAVDRDLVNERTYYYTVWARFHDHDGALKVSRGISIEAMPGEPPKPVEELKITESTSGSSRGLVLEFDRPAKGEVAILHTRQPAGLRHGAVLSLHDLQRCGQTLSAAGTRAWVAVEGPGIHYFTPAVIYQQMAYIGSEQRYVYAEDVTDLKVQNMGFALRAQWRWPVGCKEVVVAYSTGGWPEPSAQGTATRPLTRAQYDLNGYFDIPNPGAIDLYVRVFAVTQSNGERFLSGGQSPAARKRVALGSRITLNYAIKKARFGGALNLEMGRQGTGTWPALLLVRKQGSLPMSSADGEVLLRIDASTAGDERRTFSLPRDAGQPQAYARLFLEDSSLYECVVIRDPDLANTKLF